LGVNGTRDFIESYLTRVARTVLSVDPNDIEEAIGMLSTARALGKRIFIFGNGGSAATASHFACDLAKGSAGNGGEPLKVISLTDNVPLMTAYANDADYSAIFSMQLEPLVEQGDLVIGISGSGNSPNVLRAIEAANLHGAVTLALTGFDGGTLMKLASHSIHVASQNMQHVEDVHMVLVHLMSSALRNQACPLERDLLLWIHRDA
jgi:D-sedoheptulose 7-phosphate isomerase